MWFAGRVTRRLALLCVLVLGCTTARIDEPSSEAKAEVAPVEPRVEAEPAVREQSLARALTYGEPEMLTDYGSIKVVSSPILDGWLHAVAQGL